jgi:hypothetical protein
VSRRANRFHSIEYTCGDGCQVAYDETFDCFVLCVQNVGTIKVELHRFVPHRMPGGDVPFGRSGVNVARWGERSLGSPRIDPGA